MRTLDNSAQIFNSLSDVPGDVQDVEELIEVLKSSYSTSENSVILLKNFTIPYFNKAHPNKPKQ